MIPMRAQRFFTIACLLLWTATHTYAYVERDLLQKTADLEKVRSVLVPDQKWVPYPDYADRTGWDQFLGEYKDDFIKQGEKQLSYTWKVVTATDYLEYERSGNRRIMEDPFGNILEIYSHSYELTYSAGAYQ